MNTSYLQSMIITVLSFAPYVASAQEKCIVNGREVPCAEAFQTVKTAVGWGIGFFAALFVAILLALIFWLAMLIHAIRRPIENRALWIFILLLTGIIGATVYYFVVKRKMAKAASLSSAAQ